MKSPSLSDMEKELLSNVQNGAVMGVVNSLKRGININAHTNTISGDTALHFAVIGQICNPYVDDKCPYLKIAKILLKNGADINCPNFHGVTPLELALLQGKMKMVQLFLNKGSDTNKILKGIQKELDIHHQTRSIVDSLIRSKTFRLNYSDYPMILLQFALRHGDEKTFEMILKKKVEFDINAILPTMRSPIIHLAVQNGNVKMIRDLVDHGVDIERRDINGDAPIHEAIKEGRIDLFLYFLQCGASVFSENLQGRNALHIAAEYKADIKMLYLILSKGIDINGKSQLDGKTPLHVACTKVGTLEIVKFLVENGADVSSRDRFGDTPLHMAMKCFVREEVVEYLLKLNADVNIQNVNGETPLSGVLQLSYINDTKVALLVKVLARMIASKLKVCPKNVQVIEHNIVKDYYNTCNSEISRMTEKISPNNNVLYLDLFTKDVQNCSMFVKNEDIVKVLNSRSYLEKFRIYGDFLEEKLNRIKSRNVLMEKAADIFFYQLKPELPHLVLNTIFPHLSYKDLQTFVNSFHWKKKDKV